MIIKKAVSLDPFRIECVIGRGNLYCTMGEYQQARRDYGRVLHYSPHCKEAFLNIGYAYQKEGYSKRVTPNFFGMQYRLDP